MDELNGGGSHGAVVYMHSDDGELVLVPVPLEEHGLVDLALAEVEGQEYGPQLLVPVSPRLFETVQSLHKV